QENASNQKIQNPVSIPSERGSAGLSGVPGRNHRPHVVGQFAVALAEAQIELALRPVRRQAADHVAFGSERLKPLQFGFKVSHDAPSLTATRGNKTTPSFYVTANIVIG